MKPKYMGLLFLGIFSVWAFITCYLIPYIASQIPDDTKAGFGQVGDSFGAVNALFSGLAFGGIIITLIMQKEELKLQRDQLAESVRAQKESSKSQQVIAELSARQTLLEYYKYCQMSEDGYYEQKGKTKGYFINKMEEESSAISSILSKVTVVDKEGNDSLKP